MFALALVAVAACPRSAPPAAPLDATRAGVRVRVLAAADAPRGEHAQGRAGDLLLASARLRAIVGRGGTPERDLARGSVLDLVTRDFGDDDVEAIRAVVRGRTLSVRSVEPVVDARRAAVRVVQATRDGALVVTTEIAIQGDALSIDSAAENRGFSPIRQVSLGDRAAWLGGPAWIPGAGSVEHGPLTARAPWFARRGRVLAYALVFPDAPADIEVPGGRREPASIVAWSPPVDLAPGASVRFRSFALAAPASVPELAARAWALAGVPVGHAKGKLAPAPAWASVEARGDDDKPALVAEADKDGGFDLPLPGGDWRLILHAPGGTDEQRVRVEPRTSVTPRFIVPEARTLRYRVMDTAGQPLPARIVVRGIDGTKDPAFGPPHLASGAGMVAYTADGDGALELPRGRYRVLFTHGVEYSLDQHDIDVTDQQGATVRATLDHVVDTPGWLACDFHLHAAPSGDSDVPLADRVTALLAEHVEFAVATDHNHVTDYGPLAAKRLGTIPGVEITTSSWGHFNAFPYPVGDPPPFTVAPDAIFAAVRERAPRAIIQVNHPRMGPDIGYFSLGQLDAPSAVASRAGFSFDFDTIEVFNGFSRDALPDVERNLADWAALMLAGHPFTAVGNSDSHSLVFQWAGYPRTYVEVDDAHPGEVRPEDVAAALRHGRALVTTGPFIEFHVGPDGPGSLVRAEGGRITADIRVRAAPWIDVTRVEVRVDGRTVAEQGVTGSGVERLRWQPVIQLERDAFVTVVARGERPMDQVLPGPRTTPFAFTNPILVDVDGDGAYTPPGPRAPPDAGAPPRATAEPTLVPAKP